MSGSNETEWDSDDFFDQAVYDTKCRRLLIQHATEKGPGSPIFYTTEIVRSLVRGELARFDAGVITEDEFITFMRDVIE